jgi:hypothetical protein
VFLVAPCPIVTEARGDHAELELWRSDAEALSLTWDLVETDFLPAFELRAGDHGYAALRRSPREGWLWNWQWIAETATSRWAIRSGGFMSIRARDRITDMATGSVLGVFRSWVRSTGVFELTDRERFDWNARRRQDRYFADQGGHRQITFLRCEHAGALGPYCQVELVNSTQRSPHCLLLCCFGLHLMLDPPGQRWWGIGGNTGG